MAKLPTLKKVDVNKKKKKKILLLSDDMRMHSGVGTMSRELVLNSVHEYDWVQVGGAIKHPDNGQKINISQDVAITDLNLRLDISHTYVEDMIITLTSPGGTAASVVLMGLQMAVLGIT